MGSEQPRSTDDAMMPKVIEIWKNRVFAYNCHGGVVASSICDEQEVPRMRKDMMTLPGAFMTYDSGPILHRREIVEDE